MTIHSKNFRACPRSHSKKVQIQNDLQASSRKRLQKTRTITQKIGAQKSKCWYNVGLFGLIPLGVRFRFQFKYN